MMMLDDDERTNGRQQVIAWAYVHNWVLPCNRLAAKKTRKFHHIFFYYSIFFLLFLFASFSKAKSSSDGGGRRCGAAAMQWPEDATRVSEASKA
jgi:hypothetical protein